MEVFKPYMLKLKNKLLFNYKDDLKNKITLFLRHFDNDGYIIITNDIRKEFINIVETFIINRNYDKKCLELLKSNDFLEILNVNQKLFIRDFYENISFRTSNLIMKNILYQVLSKILYFIYFFSITLLSFEEYFTYNTQLVYDEYHKVKEISDYILYYSDPFEDNGLTPTSFKLLSLGHLLKKDFINAEDIILENLDYSYARIALELDKNQKKSRLLDIFNDIKKMYYAPATPMFFHSLTKYNILSSCFLLDVEDNTDSIGELLKKITKIQKFNSGIGINFSKIRAKGRPVLNGSSISNGIEPFITILGTLSEHFKNNKRQRSANINISLSIDHPDIESFISLKMANVKKEDKNLNNIFLTVIIPDEFMYRFLKNEDWYLISPDNSIDSVHLYDVYGEEYSKLYKKMIESPNIEKKKVSIGDLFSNIVNAMLQTGGPFIFFKDCVNHTSNHKHHGIIQGTNLCTEIFEYFNENETACCNLTSLNLKKFVKEDKTFDFKLFEEKIYNIVYNLNNSIDIGLYSHPACEKSNLDKRPMGIGIQGLANMFNDMDIAFIDGKEMYKKISEALYYYALKASNDLAKKNLFTKYDSEKKSSLNQGVFCFDLFKEYQLKKKEVLKTIPKFKLQSNKIKEGLYASSFLPNNKEGIDWDKLKEDIKTYGVVNSLLIAFMPTSLSSGIYDNIESFEPMTYNILKRDFSIYSIICYNNKLVEYLLKNNYYTEENVLNSLTVVEGDFMKLENVPLEERKKLSKYFETIYNFSSKEYVKFMSCNNHLIDQGKSSNIYVSNNNHIDILKTIIDLWIQGAKTTYYYRSEIKINPKALTDFNDSDVCYACG